MNADSIVLLPHLFNKFLACIIMRPLFCNLLVCIILRPPVRSVRPRPHTNLMDSPRCRHDQSRVTVWLATILDSCGGVELLVYLPLVVDSLGVRQYQGGGAVWLQ